MKIYFVNFSIESDKHNLIFPFWNPLTSNVNSTPKRLLRQVRCVVCAFFFLLQKRKKMEKYFLILYKAKLEKNYIRAFVVGESVLNERQTNEACNVTNCRDWLKFIFMLLVSWLRVYVSDWKGLRRELFHSHFFFFSSSLLLSSSSICCVDIVVVKITVAFSYYVFPSISFFDFKYKIISYTFTQLSHHMLIWLNISRFAFQLCLSEKKIMIFISHSFWQANINNSDVSTWHCALAANFSTQILIWTLLKTCCRHFQHRLLLNKVWN